MLQRLVKLKYVYGNKIMDVGSIDFFEGGQMRVNDEFIGGQVIEFAGFLDINKQEMYEFDAFKCNVPNEFGSFTKTVSYVVFCYNNLAFEGMNSDGTHLHLNKLRDIEKIGNILINPELFYGAK